MKLKKAKLSWSDGRADKFIYIALILRVEEELSNFIFLVHVFLKLFLILDHMFENEFLFWCILFIG